MARSFSGADADARLDSALSGLPGGETVLLEPSTYTKDRTGTDAISNRIHLVGTGQRGGTTIDADWDITDSASTLEKARISGGQSVTVSGTSSMLSMLNCPGTISVGEDRVTISHITSNGSITFQSGTSDGSVAAIAGSVTVTDNGTNAT